MQSSGYAWILSNEQRNKYHFILLDETTGIQKRQPTVIFFHVDQRETAWFELFLFIIIINNN